MHQGRVSLCRIYMKFDLSVSVYDGMMVCFIFKIYVIFRKSLNRIAKLTISNWLGIWLENYKQLATLFCCPNSLTMNF